MIRLKNLSFERLMTGKRLTKHEEIMLSGDIQGWLLSYKNVACDVEIK